jgi:rhodanese-related sulfurtransferase
MPQLSVNDAYDRTGSGDVQFVDVRRIGEHDGGHAQRTVNIPLNKIGSDFEQLDPSLPTYVICEGGYRSSIGTSILENAGFKELFNVTGGTNAWKAAGLPIESSEAACAVTK